MSFFGRKNPLPVRFPAPQGRLDGDDTMTEIYLDNSATTRVDPQAAACPLQLMEEEYGNPSSLDRKGFAAQLRLDKAREQLPAVLGVTGGAIVFTGSGSEGNNLAIQGTVSSQEFMTVFTMVITFYFGSQVEPGGRS